MWLENKQTKLTRTDLSRRVATAGAGLLLDVERSSTTSAAESVRLVVTFTETGGTLYNMLLAKPFTDKTKQNPVLLHWILNESDVVRHCLI